MKTLLLIFFLCGVGQTVWAQPANDDCGGLIDLGVLPACPNEVFTNVNATASDIGFGNIPLCFNGGTVQRDVWFSFTTSDTLVDVTIAILPATDGPNGPILNPQLAVYRGDCEVDGLAELACAAAEPGQASLQLDLLGLTPNTTYFLRINDFSASATPNWGDFTLCLEEYVPAINMGESESTTACFGTLYDSGGPDGDYGNNELFTFTICPNEPGCIQLDMVSFNMENGFDELTFYAGANTSAPLIATITGGGSGEPFPIQASSPCVTVQFDSDGSVTQEGFELTWSACSSLSCDASLDNPTVIGSLPFNSTNETTCNSAATFASSPCTQDAFLNGPEAVYIYESPGGLCASIQVTGANAGTGVLVLNGPPTNPGTSCVAQGSNGSIGAANFQAAGTYYIVVANGSGCTDFNLSIEETDCALSPALVDALCNPLNGCIEEGGVPSVFLFEDGFQDMEITDGVNDGCWLGVGIEPDFYWFTIESQADGPFGFILESGDIPSDIDFSVWGPFGQSEVCETPQMVIDFIANNQPLRSSWAAGADPTGLADIHPVTGQPVTDEYDCGDFPGAGGDDFVSTIQTTVGEVYVVLVNDFGNQIADAGISVDWSPSAPEVLAPVPIVINGLDTAICSGESVQLTVEAGISSIEWIDPTGTLSCANCFDPVATPSVTTTYQAVVDAVCYTDTVDAKVVVFSVDAGPDIQLCSGQVTEIMAGSNYENATYEWTAPPGITLSCVDCPNPEVVSDQPGDYELTVTLFAPTCTLTDAIVVSVNNLSAPAYGVAADTSLCEGESLLIGGPADEDPEVQYSWVSVPGDFTSGEANPLVSPAETTWYQLTVTGGECPFPIVDSVLVEVFNNPVISVEADTSVCQGEPVLGSSLTPEADVTYAWSGPETIGDPADPNTLLFPQASGAYVLTAARGACEVSATIQVEITEISVDIGLTSGDTLICRGEEVDLSALTSPANLVAEWTASDGSVNISTNALTVAPQSATSYFAAVSVPGCVKIDTITIVVDSLPADLSILPADTMVCEGAPVVLTSPLYDPSDFPEIEFAWTPEQGQQTSDTLFNLVITPDTTRQYQRISRSGVCVDTSVVQINVEQIIPITILPADPTICLGESVQLTAQAGEPLENISWQPAETLSCDDCPNPVATPGATTTYAITAGELGCSGASTTVTVLNTVPVISLNPDRNICPGEAIQLNLDADTISTYTWTVEGDPTVISNDPFLVVTPEQTTTYRLVAENDEGCNPLEVTITVTVFETPVLTVTPDTVICPGDPLQLIATTDAPAGIDETFVWTYNDQTAEGPVLELEQLADPTGFTLTYTYGDDCGPLSETVFVNIDLPVLIDSLRLEPEIYDSTAMVPGGEPFELFTAFEPDGDFVTEWTWDGPGAPGIDNGLVLTPDPLPLPGTYRYFFTVVTEAGCVYTNFRDVTIIEPLAEMPNAFTPNGDGDNDFFGPVTFGGVNVTEFKVYNRWGQLVYDNDNPMEGWDGNYNGNPAPSDVYMYFIVIESEGLPEPIRRQGEVVLLR